MNWIESKGNGYTVPLTAYYWVHVETNDSMMMYEAEDEAWNMLEDALKKTGEDFEIYETVENYIGISSYSFKLRVDFKIYAVAYDADVAYSEAETLVEDIVLPNNITYEYIEQRELMEEEEPVYILHGDNV